MKLSRAGLGRIALAAAAAGLALLPAALSATEDRRRAVGNWLIEDIGEDEDGRRTVRMIREEGDYRLEYEMSLSPDTSDVASHGFLVTHFNCTKASGESLAGVGRPAGDRIGQLRSELMDGLLGCSAPTEDAEALLQGLAPALELADQWADEHIAHFAAVIPEGDMGDMGLDMNAAGDINMLTDMNMSGDAGYIVENAVTDDPWTNASEADEPE